MIVGVRLSASTMRISELEQSGIVQTQRLAEEAKWALIGYAAAKGSTPGSLPCPDPDGSGKSNALAGLCTNAALTTDRITGCLPWLTFGLDQHTDASGAPLLYALSTSWRSQVPTSSRTPADESVGNSFRPINLGNSGSIDLHSEHASPVTMVAAIITAGPALPGQARDTVSLASLCAGNFAAYLENGADNSGLAITNSSSSGPLLVANSSDTFNDKILPISREDVFRPLIAPILRLFADDTGVGNHGLPYYFLHTTSSPSDLVKNVFPTPSSASQKSPSIMNRLANFSAFDSAVAPSHPTIASTSGIDQCPTDNANKPADWLCFNNWYQYLAFNAVGVGYTLSLTLDKTKPSRTCSLAPPYTSGAFTCVN
ncbi:MAG TPA: hypothetical protein VLC92_16565 [Rhodocyclaceae bacterium]|nr:hypothetical protein [Rhodocyclaceae bacterium]